MPSVKDILAVKGSRVLSIGPEATALEAAVVMNEHRVGSLVVMVGRQLIGIISERDILTRVVVPRLDPGRALVRDVMTKEVVCCRLHTDLDEARGVLKNRRIRHLPVVDDDQQILGLISIGDLNAYEAHDHEATIHVLREYIYGRA
jgi:CBS domain-containing protein